MATGGEKQPFFHTARAQRTVRPHYYGVYPGNTLKTAPLQRDASAIQNSVGGAAVRTLGPMATGGGQQPTFVPPVVCSATFSFCDIRFR